jgi:hypothetical protein
MRLTRALVFNIPTSSTPGQIVKNTGVPDPSSNSVSDTLVMVLGIIMSCQVILHMIRQSWYIWGGDGAYAFPYDK